MSKSDLIVKICGLSTPETLEAAITAGADMTGFVFFPKSPRHLSLDRAALLGVQVRGRVQKAALVVDADDAALEAVIAALKPDLLQLHGRETPERVAVIKARFGVPVMKVIGVSQTSDLAVVPAYAAVSDRFLFDAKPPKDALLPGGNGRPFDWHLLENLDPGKPFMLSGGLDAANVAEAIAIVTASNAGAAFGVDVSSGVESAPGIKDPARIENFIRAARAAWSQRDQSAKGKSA